MQKLPDRGLFEYDTSSFEYDRGLLRYDRGLLEYAVIASGTGGGDVVVGPHEAQVHGQQRAAHVGDGKWYTEGVHLAVRLHHMRPHINPPGDRSGNLLAMTLQCFLVLQHCDILDWRSSWQSCQHWTCIRDVRVYIAA